MSIKLVGLTEVAGQKVEWDYSQVKNVDHFEGDNRQEYEETLNDSIVPPVYGNYTVKFIKALGSVPRSDIIKILSTNDKESGEKIKISKGEAKLVITQDSSYVGSQSISELDSACCTPCCHGTVNGTYRVIETYNFSVTGDLSLDCPIVNANGIIFISARGAKMSTSYRAQVTYLEFSSSYNEGCETQPDDTDTSYDYPEEDIIFDLIFIPLLDNCDLYHFYLRLPNYVYSREVPYIANLDTTYYDSFNDGGYSYSSSYTNNYTEEVPFGDASIDSSIVYYEKFITKQTIDSNGDYSNSQYCTESESITESGSSLDTYNTEYTVDIQIDL